MGKDTTTPASRRGNRAKTPKVFRPHPSASEKHSQLVKAFEEHHLKSGPSPAEFSLDGWKIPLFLLNSHRHGTILHKLFNDVEEEKSRIRINRSKIDEDVEDPIEDDIDEDANEDSDEDLNEDSDDDPDEDTEYVDVKDQDSVAREFSGPERNRDPNKAQDTKNEESMRKIECWEDLILLIIKKYPQIMREPDMNGLTFMHNVASESENLLSRILNEVPPVEGLVTALETTQKEDKTCLHLALENPKLSKATIMKVILLVDKKVLGMVSKHEKKTPLHLAVQRTSPDAGVVQLLVGKWPSALTAEDHNVKSPYQLLTTRSSEAPHTPSHEKIIELLKYYVIKELDNDDAEAHLYKYPEIGPHRHLRLQLGRLVDKQIDKTFIDCLKKDLHLPLESILSKVSLPALNGSEHHLEFFDYLRDKKVTRILNLAVADMGTQDHCDGLIEDCLQGLTIDSLDWQREDVFISNLCPDIKDLCLYSSGKKTVLDHWSSKRGLQCLKKLESVKITFFTTPLSKERIRTYRVEFLNRMLERKRKDRDSEAVMEPLPHDTSTRSYCLKWKEAQEFTGERGSRNPSTSGRISREITFDFVERPKHMTAPTEGRISEPGGIDGKGDPDNNNLWYQHMHKFSIHLEDFLGDEYSRKQYEKVKVAIIDDGIDVPFPGLKIGKGKSFCEGDDDLEFFVGAGGHGTLMARFAQSLSPQTVFYVARVHDFINSGHRMCTARSVRRAINWAIDMGVDIITMSLSLDYDDTETAALNTALRRAQDKKIVVFCAHRDGDVAQQPNFFAARSDTISIAAATSAGRPAEFANQKDGFYLPGDKIITKNPTNGKLTNETGSSISTALAAGLAAHILYCNEMLPKPVLEREDLRLSMKDIFEVLCKGSGSDRFLQVWKFFEHENATSLEGIQKITEQLVRSSKQLKP
ncbi:hypothetical protein G7Y89_g13234 [Cudoniella acicularis]|uniref:Peptidase S8/S53 domain-containing protein n=1 Tax=Cudoniella acicularis TaxID=354080 RepID=A0A8H4R7A5_9HELO|nr:hypothetical protein G7Y89_g13234 [Cudoniella acicularis]